MTDPVPDTKPPSRWLWVALLVLLAIATIIFVFNADGDEELDTIPDEAITTTEERLYTDLGNDEDVAGMVDGSGTAPQDPAETVPPVDPMPAE